MTVSHWRASDDLGSIRCDVLVIGAGVCGISAALHLQRRGVDVRVVERDELCSGASGRNAGFLMRGAADNYAAAVRAWGPQRAKDLWTLTESNLAGLRREGIEQLSGYRAVPSVLLAIKDAERNELLESVRLMHADGFRVRWDTSGDDAAWRSGRALGGLVNPDDASCHPIELVRFLAAKLRRPIHERQEVIALEPEGATDPAVRVRTRGGIFTAQRVLVCTNAYAPLLFPSLARAITPRRGQMLALRAKGLRLDASYYANHGSEYFRQAADGAVVVGGCRTYHADKEIGYEDRLTPWVQNDLERFATEMLGQPIATGSDTSTLQVVNRWSGTMGFSFDELPLVGPVEDALTDEQRRRERSPFAGRVWFCGAFTGHGMSMAYRTSELAVEAMLNNAPNPFPIARARDALGNAAGNAP